MTDLVWQVTAAASVFVGTVAGFLLRRAVSRMDDRRAERRR